jgi:uncharacterized protein YciI
MPHYVFRALDRPGSDATRAAFRERHRQHIRLENHGCRCVLAGPLFDRPDGPMIGSLLIFDAPSKEAVASFMRSDPYVQAEVFYSVEIHAWLVGQGSIV